MKFWREREARISTSIAVNIVVTDLHAVVVATNILLAYDDAGDPCLTMVMVRVMILIMTMTRRNTTAVIIVLSLFAHVSTTSILKKIGE